MACSPIDVVAQLCGKDGPGRLGVDDGAAREGLRPMERLKFQFGLVVAPGAVGHSHHRLPTLLQYLDPLRQVHGLGEETL